MNGKDHLIVYAFAVMGLIITSLITSWLAITGRLVFMLLVGVIINPDIDQWFYDHRNAFFHSAFFPFVIYWAMRPYLIMDDYLTKEFGVALFFPVLVHLLADFKPGDKITGFATISLFGFKRLNEMATKVYVGVNCAAMVAYIIWVL